MLKKIISAILTISLCLGICGSLSGCNSKKNDALITRGEWVTALATNFGMDEFQTDNPYYFDVKSDSDIFAFVQSCREWELFKDKGSMFKPNDKATKEFIVQTAVIATGVLSGEELKENIYSKAIDYAFENKLITDKKSSYLNKSMTISESAQIIIWALDTYRNKPFHEYQNVVLNNNVKDYKAVSLEVENENVNIAESDANGLKVGDIIITAPTKIDPMGVARKIVDIKYENGKAVLITEEPEIGEVFENLDIASIAVPKTSDIIPSKGVTVTSGAVIEGTNYNTNIDKKISTLAYKTQNNNFVSLANDGIDFSLNVNFTKGTIKINTPFLLGSQAAVDQLLTSKNAGTASPELGNWFKGSNTFPDKNLFGKDPYDNEKDIQDYKDGKITAEEFKSKLNQDSDGWEKKPSITNKYNGGYEIIGSLGIKNFYVKSEMKLKNVLGIPTGIKHFSVEVNYECEASLSVKGEIKTEITVASVPIPIGPSGVVIDVDFILSASANGEIKVKAVIKNNTICEYENGNTRKNTTKDSSLSADANLTIETGPAIKATLKAYAIKLINVNLNFNVVIKANAGVSGATIISENGETLTVTRQTSYKWGVAGYIPIIKLSIGTDPATLADKLKIKFSWTLCDENSAYKFDIIKENKAIIWQDVQTFNVPKDTQSSSRIDSSKNDNNIAETLDIDKYSATLDKGKSDKIIITKLPKGYKNSDCKWSSSNQTSVIVNNQGDISAIGEGVSIITVATNDGKYLVECSVLVNADTVIFKQLV